MSRFSAPTLNLEVVEVRSERAGLPPQVAPDSQVAWRALACWLLRRALDEAARTDATSVSIIIPAGTLIPSSEVYNVYHNLLLYCVYLRTTADGICGHTFQNASICSVAPRLDGPAPSPTTRVYVTCKP